jgi:NADPH2:quinone reductase
MRAAWYEQQGAAREVLQVGEMPVPEPSRGEVRIRVAASGIHGGDLGKRRGWWGSTMAFPRVIPHGDGAGVIEAVGPDVARGRLGERVWTYLAQSYRPFGTAAEYVVVPAERAVPLPAEVPFEQAAGLGIPGITAHRAVFADGPVNGSIVVVTGALGAVGRAAVAVARRGGATVIPTIGSPGQIAQALNIGAHHAIDVSSGNAAERVLDYTGGKKVDRPWSVALVALWALWRQRRALTTSLQSTKITLPGSGWTVPIDPRSVNGSTPVAKPPVMEPTGRRGRARRRAWRGGSRRGCRCRRGVDGRDVAMLG